MGKIRVGQLDTVATKENLDSLAGGWASYTPSLTNLTLGNGTLVARYKQIGSVVFYQLSIIFGSTTSIGTNPVISLPTSATIINSSSITGQCMYRDNSAPANYTGFIEGAGNVRTSQVAGAYLSRVSVTATVPFTWTIDDNLTIHGYYEAA